LFDVDADRVAGLVVDGEDRHVGQSDKTLTHARSVGLHRGSGGSNGVGTTDSSSPCAAPGGPLLPAYTPLRSEVPFFPELLEPRRRIDKALWAVIMTAYITGTSTLGGSPR
jgi:putative transposase